MWISLFFFQGFVISALGGQVKDLCIDALLRCSPFQISFTERTFSDFFIESPALLERKCKSQVVFMDCVFDAIKACGPFVTPAQSVFIENRDLAAQLCDPERGTLRERYLKNAVCINKQKPWTNLKCNSDGIAERIQESYPLIDFSCRYQKALLKCRRKVITKNCGQEAGNIFKRVMNLELNLDYLCIDKKYLRDPSQYLMEIVNSFIGMLLEAIRPILGLETDFLEAIQASDESLAIKTPLGEYGTENEPEPTVKACVSGHCHSHRKFPVESSLQSGGTRRLPSSGRLPNIFDYSEVVKDEELHRFGDFMETTKSVLDSGLLSNLEKETTIALKFYGEVLTELASMSTPAKPEPKPAQKLQNIVAESCQSEICGVSRIGTSFQSFEQESSVTSPEKESGYFEVKNPESFEQYSVIGAGEDFEADNEVVKNRESFEQEYSVTGTGENFEADNEVENPEEEANPEYILNWGMHFDFGKIKVLDPLKLYLKPLLDGKLKINYLRVGRMYLPLEINFKEGDNEYFHRANVKISQKKYYITPSTETLPAFNFVVEDPDQPSPDLESKTDYCESDIKHQFSKWTESENVIEDSIQHSPEMEETSETDDSESGNKLPITKWTESENVVEDSIQHSRDISSEMDDSDSGNQQLITKWTGSANEEIPEELGCEIKGNSTPLDILEETSELPYRDPQYPEAFLTWKSRIANGAVYEEPTTEKNIPEFLLNYED